MSLVNQSAWAIGCVRVVGRGITRGSLQAGATAIVNSRSGERLEKIKDSLGSPERLICAEGSLSPGAGSASKAAVEGMKDVPLLNHAEAHGYARCWARPSTASFNYYEHQPGKLRNGVLL